MSLLDCVVSGIQQKPQRFLLYGVEGVGKTEFAAQFPSPVFLAAEDGTSHVNAQRFVPRDWNQICDFMAELSMAEERPYQTLCLDTAKWAEQLCSAMICKREQVSALSEIPYGKGKGFLLAEFNNFLSWCSYLYGQGLNIVFIGHASVKTFQNPEGDNYDRYTLQMVSAELAEMLKQWCDVNAFMNFDTHIEEKQIGMRKERQAKSLNRRIMHFQRSAAFDAKNRYQLPKSIDCSQAPRLAYEKYMAEYEQWPARKAALDATATAQAA